MAGEDPVVVQNPLVVILAGGRGSRLAEETQGLIPKPMLRIGDMPMLEHIMRSYSAQGMRRFIIATGFMGNVIDEWVHVQAHSYADEIMAIDTGLDTQTGGRLLRLAEFIGGESFMLTYGDGLADINMKMLLDHHRTTRLLITLSAVHPPARFGNLVLDGPLATRFNEKSQTQTDWINGGFYVLEPGILDLIPGDECRLEYDVLPSLAVQGRLAAYRHPGFFQMCDTFRDLQLLKQIWKAGDAPWKRW
jgi:glucose-1-phosphate cytidylyltransferase